MPNYRLSRIVFHAAIALAVAWAGQAVAARADSSQPTTVDADSLRYDDLKQTSIFTGNVVLTKGSLILRADRLELREDPEGYQYGVATANPGKLVYVRQRREGKDEYIEGEGERVEYDGRNELIHFISKAVARRLECEQMVDEVRGQRITYNQRTETYTATGGPQAPTPNRRVRTVIQPRGQAADGTPAAGCPATPAKGSR
ncbi:lipopolysaccharide transport periplasmic protein LptA [Pigmentiphaga sp.]|uniref:lipopolysaccharide transport periplasmic protein LptA n=1 Tax=Pigmentiphaga sp. TaxID=1977564 RepID=UPI0025EE7398|nr:lipopolysaccharide transport periplasmic protein LptA [Pigmentiphaga sp.]MBX6318885.1 lipopolysaccharide transport periplasmic protein LptA [Pigmentiphaga sp.]